MQAFGNEEALSLSIESGYAHYFSRKRNSIWKKGEESGMIQSISQIYYLSETPSIIFQTKEKIPSCHTGFYSCFYRKLEKDSFVTNYSKKEFDPNQIYGSKNSGNLKSL
ncbi:MAG: phosphoribosyl-AMP cyclohydrolase [Leptospiraceae bacterium]|nr:phosphoribosyl-AMP cyclohydrolase [Leptospiraceae bacterium]NUM41377.1 phosphoribosyl-AMP cyclohydrolase [Leptospiraceae bacterium]